MDGKAEERNGQLTVPRVVDADPEEDLLPPSGDHGRQDPPFKRLELADEGKTETGLTWRDTIPQLYVSLCANSVVVHAGINMAFSSILLPELSKETSAIHVTADQASWIASSVTLSTPIGALAAGPLMDRWGRLTTARLACLPLALAWATMALSSSMWALCAGRALAGIGGGLTTVALVYVSECAHPHLRPALLSLNSVAVSLGVLGTYALSAALPSWRWVAWCCLGLALLSLAALSAPLERLRPPESPHWLYLFDGNALPGDRSRGGDNVREAVEGGRRRRALAMRVLRKLNPSEAHFEEAHRRLQLQALERRGGAVAQWGLGQILGQSSSRRPLLLILVLFLCQQLSGTYVIVFYAVDVLRGLTGEAGSGNEANEVIALILLGIIRLLASIAAAILSRHIGRKPLCAASGIGMFIAALSSGLLDTSNGSSDDFSPSASSTWPGSALVLIHVCAAALGVLVIPWTLIGELLPAEARGLGGGLSVCIAYAFMFAAIKGFPAAQNAIGGTKALFLFFSASSLVGVAFLLLCIPETLGRSLHEIENHFKGVKNYKRKWWWGWNAWAHVKKSKKKIECEVG
ncbi:facilitated trehalose transporter Tret1-like isoform X1 [Hetaerina americana]|uniref:facilitated trehalose transporter Tret1-like isoform X1 n=1 Tax=Hetaerina americana TaxID=62018 RepID=UPI003A7F5FB2